MLTLVFILTSLILPIQDGIAQNYTTDKNQDSRLFENAKENFTSLRLSTESFEYQESQSFVGTEETLSKSESGLNKLEENEEEFLNKEFPGNNSIDVRNSTNSFEETDIYPSTDLSTTTPIPSEETDIYPSTDLSTTTPIPSIETCPRTEIKNLIFPETALQAWTTPSNVICLDNNYDPIRVQCLSNGEWNFQNNYIICSNTNISDVTNNLFDFLNQTFTSELGNVNKIITTESENVKAIDVYYSSKILEKIYSSTNGINMEEVVDFINNLMNLPHEVLLYSQQLLNSTDSILYGLDLISLTSPLNFAKTNLLITNGYYGSGFGAIIVDNSKSEEKNFSWQTLESDYTNILNTTNFEFAFLLPTKQYDYYLNFSSLILFKSVLFNEKTTQPVGSLIIKFSLLISLEQDFIQFFFKEQKPTTNVKYDCAIWEYGTINQIAMSGRWKSFSPAERFKDGYYSCIYKSTKTGYIALLTTQLIIKCNETHFDDLFFPETSGGAWTTPNNKICLNENYDPVRIQCLQNGTWNLPEYLNCSQKPTQTTQELFDILEKPLVEAFETAKELIETNPQEFTPIDVYFISKLLDKAATNENITQQPQEFLQIINNVMNLDENVLKSSQDLLNATDTILYSLDLLLLSRDNITVNEDKLLIDTISNNNNIYGIKIARDLKNNQTFKSFKIESLYSNFTETLKDDTFEVAFVASLDSNNRYFVTLFYNNLLFNQKNLTQTVGSWIISILPTNYLVSQKFQIYFKAKNSEENPNCNYWKYGVENQTAISGFWKQDNQAKKFKDGYYICDYNHTTHFGMLVSDSTTDNVFLDLITIFGSILSLFGIIIIFLTAIVFKQWRHKATSKVIVNISSCLLLLIILFFISGEIIKGPFCIFIGIFLHYIVLVQFCWTLTISYSSYRSFAVISLDQIENVVLKYSIFSWGSPIIIIIITAAINSETYNKIQNNSLCYPKDIYLKLGVCLPMTIILSINLIIYCLIVKHLSFKTFDLRKHTTKKSVTVRKSLILLFFIMGLSWIFGVIVAFTDNYVFLYLFCMTATIHGFVAFFFYILDSTEIKEMWKEKLKTVFEKQSKQDSGARFYNGTTTESSITN